MGRHFDVWPRTEETFGSLTWAEVVAKNKIAMEELSNTRHELKKAQKSEAEAASSKRKLDLETDKKNKLLKDANLEKTLKTEAFQAALQKCAFSGRRLLAEKGTALAAMKAAAAGGKVSVGDDCPAGKIAKKAMDKATAKYKDAAFAAAAVVKDAKSAAGEEQKAKAVVRKVQRRSGIER